MPYPSAALLALAADGLTGAHAFTVITVPALLRAAVDAAQPPTELVRFGSSPEAAILDKSFKLAEGPNPYLSLWGRQRLWRRYDYASSTLQAQRTRDAFASKVFIDDRSRTRGRRTRFALQPDAGHALTRQERPVLKIALGLWLGRNEEFGSLDAVVEWFEATFPSEGTDLDGQLYLDGIPQEYDEAPWQAAPATELEILRAIGVDPPDSHQQRTRPTDTPNASHTQDPDSLEWSREVCGYTLREANVDVIVERALQRLEAENVILPDSEALVRRCVVGLLLGHLILKGPPGTGKTTLARVLADSFRCRLVEATATSEWSPYHVVGGLRTAPAGGLEASYGKVTEAVLECARVIRDGIADERTQTNDGRLFSSTPQVHQAVWLLIDEFNRADIDKAIGSLYTLLSSTEPEHLIQAPIDLWFETKPRRKRLWVPARFRIIGAMNDVDTSFVNQISQGLTRRFQFVTVGAPPSENGDSDLSVEVETAFRRAHSWLDDTYKTSLVVGDVNELRTELHEILAILTRLISRFRSPDAVSGWPVGTAQIVDILRALLLERHASNQPGDMLRTLDRAVADRLVPQMGALEDEQFEEFKRQLDQQGLTDASVALTRILDPHIVS